MVLTVRTPEQREEDAHDIVARDLELTLEYAPTMSVSVEFGTYRQVTPQPGITKCYLDSLMGGIPYKVSVVFDHPPAETEGMETVITYHWTSTSLIRDQLEESGGDKIEIYRILGQGAGPRQRALTVNRVVPKVVRTEQARLDHLAMIKQVREHADDGKFDEAQDTLAVGMRKLDELQCLTNSDVSLNAIGFFYAEAEEILNVVESEDLYKDHGGHCYVAACISSHERQRYVARGDEGCRVRLFTTDRMRRYLDDAIELDNNMARNAA